MDKRDIVAIERILTAHLPNMPPLPIMPEGFITATGDGIPSVSYHTCGILFIPA